MKTPRIIGLLFVLLLALVCRCWTWSDVFLGEETFFLDPDCYSRMTRVAQIVESPGKIIGRHDFENWPQGVMPHTTSPMDYLLALGAWIAGAFMEKTRALSLSGAWMPVALGLVTALFLWRWTRDFAWSGVRPIVMIFFAISPMLVQATVLGRPDHQALLLLLMAMALGAEGALLAGWGSAKRWTLLWGAAWGLALWVSLYEPGIFFIASLLLVAALKGRSLISRERLPGWGMLAGVLLFGLLVDGWRSPLPTLEVIKAFPDWAKTIGELRSVSPWSPVLWRWTSGLYLVAFLILPWVAYRQREAARPALFFLGLLVLSVGLTCWQVRWGYFLSLVYLLSLPWQCMAIPEQWTRRRWSWIALLAAGAAPLISEWAERFEKESDVYIRRVQQRRENIALRDLAHRISAQSDPGAILAPWWQSPALAYWTGLPCVAGSSHQSLPGTLDTARFYLSTDFAAALRLAQERRVTFVVAYEPQYVLLNSSIILGNPPLPEEESETMAGHLFRRPNSPVPGFELLGGNPYFRLFRISGLESQE